MTERVALLAAVCADPDDDTRRLAFADWCDENGQPERAEFVRLQIELHHWRPTGLCVNSSKPHYKYKPGKPCGLFRDNPAHNCQCRRDALAARERALLVNFPAAPYWDVPASLTDTHPGRMGAQGASPLTYCHGYGVREVRLLWHRGFVVQVECEASDWIHHGKRFAGRHPVKAAVVTAWRGREQQLSAEIPPWLRVLQLHGSETMTRSEAVALMSYAHSAGWFNTLRELDVMTITREALELLRQLLPPTVEVHSIGMPVPNPRRDRCPVCNGEGSYGSAGGYLETCDECGGAGYVREDHDDGDDPPEPNDLHTMGWFT